MKRFLAIFLLTVVIGLAFVHVLYRDRINLLEMARDFIERPDDQAPDAGGPTPEPRVVRDEASPPHIHNGQRGRWANDPEKIRRLALQTVVGDEASGHRFRKINDIEFGPTGEVFVLDRGNKSIEVFDSNGEHLRTLGIKEKRRRIMLDPTDMAVDRAGRIYIADGLKGILILDVRGQLLNALDLPYKAERVVIDSRGHIIVLTPGEQYLLRKFNPQGQEFVAFGEQEEPSETMRRIFSRGSLAIDARDNVYVSYIYPYQIVKFNSEGQRVLAFDRELEIAIPPPTIERDKAGKITHVFRQEISYEIRLGPDGLVYNLVKTRGAKGGNVIDVFSPEGTYLQSYYLADNAASFALFNDQLVLSRLADGPVIEKYRVEKMQ